MQNDLVKPHNFENAKNQIQTLVYKSPTTVSIKQFPTEGSIFSWNDHNVTGKEVNELLVSPLQSSIITQNNNIRSLYNIAAEVYKALESLDKEYISGIIAAVKSAEIASNQAKNASDKAEIASKKALDASDSALKATMEAKVAQNDIKKTISALKETVNVLKFFKESTSKTVERFNNDISVLQQYCAKLETCQHLSEVDVMWENLEANKTGLENLHKQVDNYISEVQTVQQEIKDDIVKLQEAYKLLRNKKEKRVKVAYYLAGTAAFLSLASFLLQLSGIL